MHRCSLFLSLNLIRPISIFNPKISTLSIKFLSNQSSSLNHSEFPVSNPKFEPSPSNPINPNPNFPQRDFEILSTLLKNSDLLPVSDLEHALNETGIEPNSSLLLAIFKQLQSSPKEAFFLFKWAEKQSGNSPSAPIFNSMITILVKSGEFKWALMVLFDLIKNCDGSDLVLAESLGILIKRYALSGMILPAIKIYKLGNSLKIETFEVLVAALCKYGHVEVASECINKKMFLDPNWVPSIDVYNMLLDGWFRVGNIKQVEKVWLRMKREKSVFDVVSFGILVEGFCRMGCVDRALELLSEMRRYDVRPNKEVYGPIVDALAGAGRLDEALGMLERFLVLESGPTLSTYNSLVKGFCKAGDLDGASRIIKMMTSRGFVPTSMTYNYFFRYFARHGKVEEGLNLYRKMVELGYEPDHFTFRLLLKMLCEEERLELALQICKEMRSKGYILDLGTSTMLINLLCKMHRFQEAVSEFDCLVQRGVVPKFVTYQTLYNELKKKGLHELARKLSDLAAIVPSFATSPTTFEELKPMSHQRRKVIMQRAKAMSDTLKACSDPRELSKHRRSPKIALPSEKKFRRAKS